MSYWNHRVVKTKYSDGTEQLSIHEVFYNADNSIFGYTEDPVLVSADNIEDLRSVLEMMVKCLDKEILIDGEVKFVDSISEDVPEDGLEHRATLPGW